MSRTGNTNEGRTAGLCAETMRPLSGVYATVPVARNKVWEGKARRTTIPTPRCRVVRFDKALVQIEIRNFAVAYIGAEFAGGGEPEFFGFIYIQFAVKGQYFKFAQVIF